MKKLVPVLTFFSLVLVLLLSACGGSKTESKAGVQYFRHLQFSETPYDQYKGIFPLTGDEAKTINHYRLTTDEAGRLTEVAYMRGETLLGYSSMDAARIAIEYTDSTEIHHFFDQGNQPKESDGVFAFVYKLDPAGKRVGLSFLDKNGAKLPNRNNISWYTWSVLPDGMVKENRFNPKGEETILNPFCPFYELRFSYDTAGFCTRMANYMADTLYNCTAENCGDIGVSYFSFTYGKGGVLESFSVHNASGRSSNLYWGWSKFLNAYDDNGYVVQTTFYDQDGELLGGKTNPITAFTIDEHGAVVERKFLDKDMKPFLNENAGAAMLSYTYQENGLPKDTLRFDVNLAEIAKK
ncbi:MAG: hypothetical protein U0T82_15025 [Bacteroidales bacterium]